MSNEREFTTEILQDKRKENKMNVTQSMLEKGINMVPVRKILIVAEVSIILVLFLYLNEVLSSAGFHAWQVPLFGTAILSSILLLFVLPLSTLILARRNPGAYGLTIDKLRQHARLALQAILFVFPASSLFLVIGLLGTDFQHWLGSSILTLGFAAAGVFILRYTRRTENIAETQLSLYGFLTYFGLLVSGAGLVYMLQPISGVVARIIIVFIFVGFLEEFFFRGYLQTRLNDVFGKPYSVFNVNYGAGLILGAVIFGLSHPLLNVVNGVPIPWAWALWATMTGLIFGFLREKSGGIVAPALLHGAILLGGVLTG